MVSPLAMATSSRAEQESYIDRCSPSGSASARRLRIDATQGQVVRATEIDRSRLLSSKILRLGTKANGFALSNHLVRNQRHDLIKTARLLDVGDHPGASGCVRLYRPAQCRQPEPQQVRLGILC